MHRFILDLTDSNIIVDHKNRNPLDNRRKNLRQCSPKENSRNLTASKRNTSGYLGVGITKHGKYRARIMVNRKEIRLGNYDRLEDAIKARQEAEKKYFKEFAPCASS